MSVQCHMEAVLIIFDFILISYGKSTVNVVNECSNANGGCEHNCLNTIGSYQCTCNSGYRMENNGHSCTGTTHVFTNKCTCTCTVKSQ